jgi:glutamate/tyrosine decarboxylase-like PLP-dependent enzyme
MTARPPAPVPDLDWPAEKAAELGRDVVALWVELLGKLPRLPIARRAGVEEVRRAVARAIPEEPLAREQLLAHLREVVLERSMYPGHPGFMAYISGAGTVPGAAADLLAAAINQNVGGWRLSPAATEIELNLVRWFAGQFGLPGSAAGLLVSGGAMANFAALKVARDARCGFDVGAKGVAAGPPMALYRSTEAHHVIDRGADMLGLGKEAVRRIPVDSEWRMIPGELGRAIERDLKAGVRPIAAVGTAGTVATGAVDPLDAIADVCARHGLWFHVDAAYGGPAVLAPQLRPLFSGIERADSIAFDPHKWLYTPHSGGCVLYREQGLAESAFALQPDYIREDKERSGHGFDHLTIGPQFSRGFAAFKVWVSLLAHGRAAYARRIAHDAALARYLADCVAERPEFELSAPVVLSICCFRYVPPDLPASPGRDGYIDRLNERLMTEIQLDGRVLCSNAVLNNRFVLRACIVNFRTEAADCDRLLDVAAEHGARLDLELRPAFRE